MNLGARLDRLEWRQVRDETPFVFWIDQGDGLLRHGSEVLTRAQYRERYPQAQAFTFTIDLAAHGADEDERDG